MWEREGPAAQRWEGEGQQPLPRAQVVPLTANLGSERRHPN
ncbi:hypothetical protein M527_20125 [Sphingobium indicum IP26]|nr:hypothetical protein M527_20125 [Sphingobium indicum IP26]